MFTLKPRGFYVAIEFHEFNLASGLVLPDQTSDQPKDLKLGLWHVIAVPPEGEGKILDDGRVIPVPFKIGDKVAFRFGARPTGMGPQFLFGKHTVAFIHCDDICGTVEGTPEMPPPQIVKAHPVPGKKELVH